MKYGIKCTILLSTVADRWDPQNSRPHTSVTQNRAAALRDMARPRLVDDEFAGGDIYTGQPSRPSALIGLLGWVSRRC